MKTMAFLSACLLLAHGLGASAARGDGLTYSFRTKLEGPIPYDAAGEAWIDGARARVNFVSDGVPGARISDPQAGIHVVLDPEKKSYYDAKPGAFIGPFTSGSAVLSGLTDSKGSPVEPGKLRVEEKELGPGEPISEMPTKKVLLKVSYEQHLKVSIERIRVVTSHTIELWLSDGVAATPFRFGHDDQLRIGIEKVDAELASRLGARGGFPLKHVVTTTQTWDKGAPSTRVLTTTLSNLRPAAADPVLFTIPKGYRHEEPVILAPAK